MGSGADLSGESQCMLGGPGTPDLSQQSERGFVWLFPPIGTRPTLGRVPTWTPTLQHCMGSPSHLGTWRPVLGARMPLGAGVSRQGPVGSSGSLTAAPCQLPELESGVVGRAVKASPSLAASQCHAVGTLGPGPQLPLHPVATLPLRANCAALKFQAESKAF